MKILAKLPDDAIPAEAANTPSLLNDSIFPTLKMCYEAQAECSDAYLDIKQVQASAVIFGFESPEDIRKVAWGWNFRIGTELADAIKSIVLASAPSGRLECFSSSALQLDTPMSYRLKKAAIAADNSWFDFADYMTLLPNDVGAFDFHPLLSDASCKLIMDNPEEYFLLEVAAR